MSFIRPGQSRKKKAFIRKRPHWDDSLSDLDSYRATPEEIRMRKEAHKSNNHIAVKLEKMRKDKQKQQAGLTNVEARQVAIMKEVLHDQNQLDTVLLKTDSMLAMVKDLFGDDARKFVGHPNVTAPTGNQQRGSNSLPGAPQIRTRIEKLSESVMSQSALNDVSGSSDDDNDDEQQPEPINFQSKLDLQSFQQFLHEEEDRNTNAIPTAASLSQHDLQRLQQLQQILLTQEQTEGNGVQDRNHTLSTISGNAGGSMQFGQQAQGPAHSTQLMGEQLRSLLVQAQQTPPASDRSGTPPKSALNDTGKVNKSRRRVQPKAEPAADTSTSMNMTDMRQVLEALQAEITDFERKTGRRSASDVENSQTFTGYTVSLVTAVTKLAHYMKETELRLQAEMIVREQLAQDVRQLAVTMDSLTQEMIMTQEEKGRLASEFHHYRQQVQGEMALLQAQVLELKHKQQPNQGSQHSSPGRAASAGSENGDDNYTALPDYVTQPSATAVLLSPVMRKTRVTSETQPEPLKAKRQTSLVDIPSLALNGGSQQEQAAAAPNASTSIAASSVSNSSSDPPRLTQTLPVVATVNVPRPIPLVQSNVGMPLSASQAAGPLSQFQAASQPNSSVSWGAAGYTQSVAVSSTTAASTTVATSLEGTRAMESQIAELNRQHAEAQQRLQSLLVQQKRQHDQLQQLQDDDIREGNGAKSHPVQQGAVPSSVSPPISPISLHSERFTQVDPAQRLAKMSREIKVAMPMVDLEVSAGSLNSSI